MDADSVSVGGLAEQDVKRISGVWSFRPNTTIGFQFDSYNLRGASQPDVLVDAQPSLDGSLDVSNLHEMGYLRVPTRIAGADEFNAAIEPIIAQYGYLDSSGNPSGGGGVGAHPEINDQAFFRDGLELTLDHTFSLGEQHHELHVGIRRSTGKETLSRTIERLGIH